MVFQRNFSPSGKQPLKFCFDCETPFWQEDPPGKCLNSCYNFNCSLEKQGVEKFWLIIKLSFCKISCNWKKSTLFLLKIIFRKNSTSTPEPLAFFDLREGDLLADQKGKRPCGRGQNFFIIVICGLKCSIPLFFFLLCVRILETTSKRQFQPMKCFLFIRAIFPSYTPKINYFLGD